MERELLENIKLLNSNIEKLIFMIENQNHNHKDATSVTGNDVVARIRRARQDAEEKIAKIKSNIVVTGPS